MNYLITLLFVICFATLGLAAGDKTCENPKHEINGDSITLKIHNKNFFNESTAEAIPLDEEEKEIGFKFHACLVKPLPDNAVINVYITAKKKNAAPQNLNPILGKYCDFFSKDDLKRMTKPLFEKSSFPVDDKCPWAAGCYRQLKIAVDPHNYPCDLPAESYELKILVCDGKCETRETLILEINSNVKVLPK